MRDAGTRRGSIVALALALFAVGRPASTSAQTAGGDDPYRYDVRTALFPIAFVAGTTQHSFGSALRGELDLGRRLTLEASGLVPSAPCSASSQAPSPARTIRRPRIRVTPSMACYGITSRRLGFRCSPTSRSDITS
jgi:hypothetical protein